MTEVIAFDFGLRLKELRKKRKLTQKEVAARLGCSENTIRHYEDNTQNPPIENLVNLALIYNSSIDYILGMDSRSNIYIDDLSPKHQAFILDMVAKVRELFEDKVADD